MIRAPPATTLPPFGRASAVSGLSVAINATAATVLPRRRMPRRVLPCRRATERSIEFPSSMPVSLKLCREREEDARVLVAGRLDHAIKREVEFGRRNETMGQAQPGAEPGRGFRGMAIKPRLQRAVIVDGAAIDEA